MDYDPKMYNINSLFLKKNYDGTIRISVIFVTTEGIQHQSGGVARYISGFIRYLCSIKKLLLKNGIDLAIYALEPALLKSLPMYNETLYNEMDLEIKKTGGRIYKIVNNSFGEDWIGHKSNWEIASASAAGIVLNISEDYRCNVVITGSTCFALLPIYIHKQCKCFNADIETVYMTNDSAFSAFYEFRDEDILSMDYLTAQWTKFTPNAKIGYVSDNMKNLFIRKYFVSENSFIPTRGGVNIKDDKFRKIDSKKIEEILNRYKIPINKKIIFSWGRPEKYKRFDLLFRVAKKISDLWPVAITNGQLSSLRKFLDEKQLEGSIIEKYMDFELINALINWKNTICVCFFSEKEPGAISPMEAMLMSYKTSCITLAHSEGIYNEIIENGRNGFLVDNKVDNIKNTIIKIINLSKFDKQKITTEAYKTIVNNYNQEKLYRETFINLFPQLKHRITI